MTREEAISAARDFVLRQKRAVLLDPEAVRPMQAARFNALFGRIVYPCDFWVVEFRKVLPPGVAAESPGSVAVEVIPVTGEVREVYVGMWLDLKELTP
jgi:hypothetical protein